MQHKPGHRSFWHTSAKPATRAHTKMLLLSGAQNKLQDMRKTKHSNKVLPPICPIDSSRRGQKCQPHMASHPSGADAPHPRGPHPLRPLTRPFGPPPQSGPSPLHRGFNLALPCAARSAAHLLLRRQGRQETGAQLRGDVAHHAGRVGEEDGAGAAVGTHVLEGVKVLGDQQELQGGRGGGNGEWQVLSTG